VDNFFESMDMNAFSPLDAALVDDVLAQGSRSASELLMLYFACLTRDSDEYGFSDAPDRIAEAISDMADDGDEEAMMAMVALETLTSDATSDEARIVGVAMMQAVASRPLLRNVISGDMDYEAAAGALSVIKMLSDGLLQDIFTTGGSDDFDDLDLDDIDFDELASQLGLSELELDPDGDYDDR